MNLRTVDGFSFAPHDRVRIGGRTMLRPGISLVGREATVFAVGGWCPAGHAQVIVDGEILKEDGGARVLLVNVPFEHLELLAIEQDEPASPFRPRLAPAESSEETSDEEPEPAPEPPENAPKGLRLV